MNPDRLNRHYQLDLDTLFSGTATGSGQPQTVSNSWPAAVTTAIGTVSSTAGPAITNTNASSSPSNKLPTSHTGLPPPPLPARDKIPSSRAPFDVGQFFSTVLSGTGSQGTVAKPEWGSGLPPPTTQAPSLPLALQSRPAQKKTALQIKRIATPTNDLLDLTEDIKIPEVGFYSIFRVNL